MVTVKGHYDNVLEEGDFTQKQLCGAIFVAVHAQGLDLGDLLPYLRHIRDSSE
jgi:hypothetical protein